MTEVLFYHMQRQPLEMVLPALLERCLERGWRAVVRTGTEERAEALDAHLWTYSDGSFLPHALDGGKNEVIEPVIVTTSSRNSNKAEVRFLVDGVPPDEDVDFKRIVVIFDGNDDTAVSQARRWWQDYRNSGHTTTYWQQNATGGWQQKN
ncbi:MAG: DNA polymerase III subunit chi [Alphaproteobacteria bacterium]